MLHDDTPKAEKKYKNKEGSETAELLSTDAG
jgi:hypothetical protein